MKPLIKKITGLLFGVLVLGFAISVNAVTTTWQVGNGVGTRFTNLFVGAARITSIIIDYASSDGATNLTYRLIDAPTTNLTAHFYNGNVIPAYTTRVQSLEWVTNWTTNFGSGLVHSSALYAVKTTNFTQVATSNAWPTLSVGVVVTQTVSTLVLPDDGIQVLNGLAVTNNVIHGGYGITVTYYPSL